MKCHPRYYGSPQDIELDIYLCDLVNNIKKRKGKNDNCN